MVEDWGLGSTGEAGTERFASVPVFRLLAKDRVDQVALLRAVEADEQSEELFFEKFETSLDRWTELSERMLGVYRRNGDLQALESGLEEFEGYLDDLLGFGDGESIDSSTLDLAFSNCLECLSKIHWAILALDSSGSSSPINVFQNLARYGNEIALEPNAWAMAVERCRDFYGTAYREVEESPLRQEPAVERRRVALLEVLASLDELEKAPEKWESGLDRLSAALAELHLAVRSFSEELYSTPTPLLYINQAYHALRRFLEGTVEDELLAESLGLLEEQIEAQALDLKLAQADPSTALSQELEEERLGLLEGLELWHRDTLEQIEEGDESGIESGLERLAELGEALAASEREGKLFLESKNSVNCPFCGNSNSLHVRLCGHCQANLPRLMHEQAGATSAFALGEGGLEGGTITTETMRQLAQACVELQSGRLDVESFCSLIESRLDETQRALEQAQKLRVPPSPEGVAESERDYSLQLEQFGNDSLQALESALDLCLEGLSLLLETAERPEVARQKRALRRYGDGCQAIYEARKAFEVAFEEA